MADWEEVVQLVEGLEKLTEELAVRGLRTAGPNQLTPLETLRDELIRVNAEHLASRVDALAQAIRSDDRQAAAQLLRLRASLRLFERMLTREVVSSVLREVQTAESGEGGQ